MSRRTVRPLRPVAPYVGGKKGLAKTIIEEIEKTPHDIYAEAFVGMAGVFLRRTTAAKVEVINDYSRDVATFFRVLQRHYTAFMEMMRFQLTTRAEFERLAATDPTTLTDLERAARFFYLQRTCFGGKASGRNFGVSADRPGRFNIVRLGPLLEDLHERLAGVVIECLDFREFIPRYDKPAALFYLDPPYFGSENYYGDGMFRRADFEALRDVLKGLQGRFIMSINDTPRSAEIFSDFTLKKVETTYTVGGGRRAKRAGELIITGPGKRRRND
ncbi:MAG: DNA adenine methylase [Rhodospirillales bacterium]